MASSDRSSEEERRIPLDMTDLPSHTLFLRQPPEELFHYTSLDGASGIISSKSLRLTKVSYLNDRSELNFAIREFRAAARRLIPDIKGSDRRDLVAEVADQLGAFEHTNICVASFCEDADLLSQWRSYGRIGRGVSLGFSGQVLARIRNTGWAHLVRCVYEFTQQQRIMEELIRMLVNCYEIAINGASPNIRDQNRTDIIGYFNTTFLRVAPVLKDAHFSEEKEWRIITVPRKTTDPKFQAIISSDRVSQYYVYDFEENTNAVFNFLKSIVVGPTSDADQVIDALHVFCMRNNVMPRSFRTSQIPYRG